MTQVRFDAIAGFMLASDLQTLLAKLSANTGRIDGYLLPWLRKLERLQVLHKLAVGGYRPSAKVDRGPRGDEPISSP